MYDPAEFLDTIGVYRPPHISSVEKGDTTNVNTRRRPAAKEKHQSVT